MFRHWQSFGYDWLDRLTSASTSAAGNGQYNHTYAYDSIGNIASYAGNTYSGSKPHAVTAAFGDSFSYDANGNRVKGTVSGTTTVYVAGLYEWQNGATTQYCEGPPTGIVALFKNSQMLSMWWQ